MLYGQVLLMKQLLEKEGVPAETYYQETTVFANGIGPAFWAVIISGGNKIGTRITSEDQFYDFYNRVKVDPTWFVGERLMGA